MSQNKLKLNADKTEVLVMGTPQMRAKISIPSITVNGVIVPVLNEPVGNLGAVFDPNMNMSAHISKVIKSANYHLRNIGKIRKFLNTDTTKSAIVSLVPGGGGGGHSGTEGGRTFVTYFAEEGVFFFETSACPRFCKRRVLFCTQVRSMGVKIPLQSTKYTRL